MAKAKITFEHNSQTGKRDIHIDYESDPSAMPYEHEDEHRDLVNRIIDLKEMQEERENEITREEPGKEPPLSVREEEEGTRVRERTRERERK